MLGKSGGGLVLDMIKIYYILLKLSKNKYILKENNKS